MYKKLLFWAPVFIWCALIFSLSSVPYLQTSFGIWDLIMRKFAHVAEYAILFLLTYRALFRSASLWPKKKAGMVAAVFSIAYAISDEFHQSFVPGRSGRGLDVCIDALGAMIGYLGISGGWKQPDPGKLYEAGKKYFLARAYNKAEGCLLRAIAINPGLANLHFELAKIFSVTHRDTSAITELERTLLLDPGHTEAERELEKLWQSAKNDGYSLSLSGRFKEISASLESLLRYDRSHNILSKESREETERIKEHLGETYADAKSEDSSALSTLKNMLITANGLDQKLKNRVINDIEVYQRDTHLVSLPRNLVVTLTTKCNISCSMCLQEKKDWMLSDTVVNEIRDMLPFIEYITWQGGEAFFHPRFEELVDAAHAHAVRQVVVTNGLLLDERIITKFLTYGVTMNISLDGVTKEVYEAIRRGGSFERLIKNIQLINTLRTRLDINTDLQMSAVVMKHNYTSLDSFVNFSHTHGFSRLRLIELGTQPGRANNNCLELPEDEKTDSFMQQTIDRIAAASRSRGIAFEDCLSRWRERRHGVCEGLKVKDPSQNDRIHRNESLPACKFPWHSLFIDAYGEVRPFCDCSSYVGNISKSSLKELWNNSTMKKYRQSVLSSENNTMCKERCVYRHA